MSTIAGVDGLEVTGPTEDRFDEVLSFRALELVALLHRELNGHRLDEYGDFLTPPAYERMP
jgi:malate synthase